MDKRSIVLLGHPLEHSLSPLIHNAAFEYQGLDYRYSLHPVHPLRLEEDLRDLVSRGLVGANVTVPHKESVVRLLDETSHVVQTIGAANTISCRPVEGKAALYGDNTDVGGFVSPIQDLLPEIAGRQALIFGSGGAARAVGYALAQHTRPERIVIAARSTESGNRLLHLLRSEGSGPTVDLIPLNEAGPEVRRSALLVNATPIGMPASAEESVWSDETDFHAGQIVYDLIYWPLETRLLRTARRRGARTLGGLEMLIAQAALSYAIWTGMEMPIEVVRQKLRDHLDASV